MSVVTGLCYLELEEYYPGMTARSAGQRDTSGFLERLTKTLELDCYAHFRLDSHGEPQLVSSSCLPEAPLLAAELLSRLEEPGWERGHELVGEVELPEALGRAGFRGAALRPLRVNDVLRGFLIFCSKGEHPFNERVRGLLDLVSEQLVTEVLADDGEPYGRTNRWIRQLILQLSEAEERERRRIANVFHGDLQQMLAGAKVHIDMAARRAGSQDVYLMERLQTAAALLNDVLERTRSISQELSPALVRRRGLQAALETLASQMKRTYGLSVDVAVTGEIPPLNESARMIIYRAVQELLFNVSKHAETNEARVEIRGEARNFELTVRDGGKGFDVDLTLGDSARPGLGLVTVRDRIDAIGGRLIVDSVPGAGSTFTISLETSGVEEGTGVPQVSSESIIPESGEGTRGRPRSGVSTVLIVDDHAVIRQGLAVLIDEEGDLEVVGEADSGEKAVEVAEQLMPDVVVMDFTLGDGIDGAEATRRIKRAVPEVTVIGLSMHGEEDTARRMMEAGAAAFLPKQGPSEDVIAAIRRRV